MRSAEHAPCGPFRLPERRHCLAKMVERGALVFVERPRVMLHHGHITLTLKEVYAEALYKDDGATLGNLREALTMLEDIERTARRVLANLHPRVRSIEESLESVRAALRDRETPSPRE